MSIEIKDWHSVHLFYSSVCDDFLCSLLMRAAFVISHRYSRGEKTQTHSKQTHCFPEAHTLVLRLRFSGGSLSVALHLAISVCVSVKLHAGEEKHSIPRVIHLLQRTRKTSGKKVNSLHSATDASWDAFCLPLHCLNHAIPHTDLREYSETTILALTFLLCMFNCVHHVGAKDADSDREEAISQITHTVWVFTEANT